MNIQVVYEFRKDDLVPDWLINVDPVTPYSQLDFIRFGMDGFIIEIEDGYVLIPQNLKEISNGPYKYMYLNGSDLHIASEVKPVAMPIGWQIIRTSDKKCQS